MQIEIKRLTLAKIFELSQLIKERCGRLSSLEEVAQELINTFCRVFITDSGKNAFVLSRFFKSCIYEELPDDIKIYIRHQEGEEEVSAQNRYLTLLGTWGDMKGWRCRKESKGHQALPLYDPHIICDIPMLSALLSQIGFDISDVARPDKNIIIDKEDTEFGTFCVEEARGSKLIPKQAGFVDPFGVKSVFGFGGSYRNNNIYAIIVFSRERISNKITKLFLSLNPAIKLLTLRHEMTGSIFNIEKAQVKIKGL